MSTTRPDASPPGGTTVVVPLRDGVSGKSRLAAALEPAARRRLVVALARHVLGVLASSRRVARVIVVTADEPFARDLLASPPDLIGSSGPVPQFELPNRTHTADVVAEPPGGIGLNAALGHARRRVRTASARPGRLLVVHADLPLLEAEDVAAILDDPADVVVATDRHGTGTNLLALPAGADFTFRFGASSRAAHEAEAAARGLSCAVVRRPGTAADLDTLADWDDLPSAVGDHLRAAVGDQSA